MTLGTFRHTLPPLFNNRRKKQRRLILFKRLFFLIVIVAIGFFTWNKFFQLSDKSSKSSISEKQSIANQTKTPKPKPEALKETTFAFAGDMMFDRFINYSFQDDQIMNIFSNFDKTIFENRDIVITNLEGPISTEPIPDLPYTGSMIFNFPPKTVDVLKDLHITTVSLANNHSSNAGSAGSEATKKILSDNQIGYFGHQSEFGDLSLYRLKNTDRQIPVSVIGVDTLEEFSDSEMERLIKTEKEQGQFIIIMPHWGYEYKPIHNKYQEAWATTWIGWGADLIIGSHPHVIQDAQIINKVPVFYSLGNFLFDQTFSKETQESIIVLGKITQDTIELSPLLTKQINLKPELVQGDALTQKVNSLAENLNVINTDQYLIDQGTFKIKRK